MEVAVKGLRPWSLPREALWQLATGGTARTRAPVALVVGTVLSLVNQGDVLASGMVSRKVVLKIAANFVIPYLTSSTGALLAIRRHDNGRVGDDRESRAAPD